MILVFRVSYLMLFGWFIGFRVECYVWVWCRLVLVAFGLLGNFFLGVVSVWCFWIWLRFCVICDWLDVLVFWVLMFGWIWSFCVCGVFTWVNWWFSGLVALDFFSRAFGFMGLMFDGGCWCLLWFDYFVVVCFVWVVAFRLGFRLCCLCFALVLRLPFVFCLWVLFLLFVTWCYFGGGGLVNLFLSCWLLLLGGLQLDVFCLLVVGLFDYAVWILWYLLVLVLLWFVFCFCLPSCFALLCGCLFV